MATSSQPTGPNSAFSNQAQWTDAETEAILQYFLNHMSEIGDAGNFKMKTYSAAAGEIPGQTRTSTQVKTKWQSMKSTYRSIQNFQDRSGLSWDNPENEQDVGRGAIVVSDGDIQIWENMIKSKKNHPMKPFRNRGWKWLRYMQNILPVAGATGARVYVPTLAIPPEDHDVGDEEIDSQIPPFDDTTSMDIDPPSASASTNVLLQPATKRPRLDNDEDDSIHVAHHSSSKTSTPPPSIPSDRSASKESRKTLSEKGKGKARAASERSSSTSQRVDKVTPAVAIVELHGSIKDMTQAIMDASKPPESIEDKAAVQCQEAVRLVQVRDDGLTITEKAALVVFFGTHNKEVDMYIALEEDELRQAVIRQWIGLP